MRRARRDPRLPGIRGILDTSRSDDVRGIGRIDDGLLTSYHVTDDPERVLGMLRRRRNLVASYGPRGQTAALGPGFYVSGVPEFWMGRSRNKWRFLSTLTGPQVDRLVRTLRRDIESDRSISTGEKERAVRDLRHVEAGKLGVEALLFLASLPYSIAFWKRDYLEPLGIQPSGQPGLVEVRLRGRFVELSRSYPSPSVLRILRRAGYQGAFTRGGMASNPELVVWDPRAVVAARVDES